MKIDPPKKGVMIRSKKGVSAAGNTRTVINVPDTPRNATDAQQKSSGQFNSGPAPRVGGPAKPTQGGVPSGGSKKQVFKSKVRVSKSSASPQAKRSAKMIYKRG